MDCRYESAGPIARDEFCGGNDAIAAIFGAIEKIGMELSHEPYHHERLMSWLAPWKGMGFHCPKGAQRRTHRDDQRFLRLD